MGKKTGPTNYQLQMLLEELKSKAVESRFWKRVTKDLNKSNRQKSAVNIYKIDRFAKDGETVLVPGKVLSVGEINKKVDVAAINFSAEAKRKIVDAKGKAISIKELLQTNPEGKKVRILA